MMMSSEQMVTGTCSGRPYVLPAGCCAFKPFICAFQMEWNFNNNLTREVYCLVHECGFEACFDKAILMIN